MSPPWMPLYVADYLGDTGHLSTIEHGAYMLLIMHYWQTASLPDDDRKLARIARMQPDEWAEVRDTLSDLFGPGWTHKRIDAELAHAQDVIGKRSAAAKAMHAKRSASAGKEQSTCGANAEHVHVQNAIPSQPQPPSPISDAIASDASAGAPAFDDGWPPDYRVQFWLVYPHRVGKSDALAKLDRIRRSRRVTFAKLMSGLDAYIASKPPDRQWCNPATWLNQGRWDDEPAPHEDRRPAIGDRGPTRSERGRAAMAKVLAGRPDSRLSAASAEQGGPVGGAEGDSGWDALPLGPAIGARLTG